MIGVNNTRALLRNNRYMPEVGGRISALFFKQTVVRSTLDENGHLFYKRVKSYGVMVILKYYTPGPIALIVWLLFEHYKVYIMQSLYYVTSLKTQRARQRTGRIGSGVTNEVRTHGYQKRTFI